MSMSVLRAFVLRAALLGAMGLLLLACGEQAEPESAEGARGGILLWHALPEAEATALELVAARFHALHPTAQVMVQRFASQDELRQAYQTAAQAGLGADIIVGPHEWVPPLAQAGILAAIGDGLTPQTLQRFVPAALETLQLDGKLYGLPLGLNTLALYYNRGLVEAPPRTLDELYREVEGGSTLLMGVSFPDAYWGIQAFGGRVLDDEQRAVLDQGGFVNWLAYLRTLRDLPATILDSNRDALRERFLEGGAAYYIGANTEYRRIADALGEDRVGVAPLPSGPTGNAGPVLNVYGLLFNDSSSASQRTLALEFAHFLTNAEQSSSLMRQAQVVPANVQVRVNPRLDPVVASFRTQAATAVAIPNITQMDTVWRLASDIYSRVLEGVAEPAAIAVDVTRAINEANGIEPQAPLPSAACGSAGSLRVGHSLTGAAAETLLAITTMLNRDCPALEVDLVYVAPEQLETAFVDGDGALDLLLARHTAVPGLVQAGALRPVSGLLPADQLQRYRAAAVELFRYRGELYGIPESVSTVGLYQNMALAPSAARTLDELRGQATAGQRILIDVRFEPAFWGVTAHGGRLLDAEGSLLPDDAALADWLTWLVNARNEAEVEPSRDVANMKQQFRTFAAPYLVGDSSILSELRLALGEDLLNVAPLPSGPEGEGQPLLRGDGYLFRGGLTDEEAARAMGFVRYATDAERQRMLVEMASRLPANTTVDVSAYPSVAQFLAVINLSQPLPTVAGIEDALRLGERAYIEVLENGRDPAEAAAEVSAAMNQALSAAASGADR